MEPVETNINGARLRQVTKAPEKGVDRRFSLVFLGGGKRQVQRMTRCIHQGIIRGILHDLDDTDDAEDRDKHDQSVTDQYDDRQNEHCASDADPPDDACDQKNLQKQRHHIYRKKETAVKSRNDVSFDRSGFRHNHCIGMTNHEFGQNVLTRGVHPVQNQDQDSHQEEVAIRQNKGNSSKQTGICTLVTRLVVTM